jgi:hypothetical protein
LKKLKDVQLCPINSLIDEGLNAISDGPKSFYNYDIVKPIGEKILIRRSETAGTLEKAETLTKAGTLANAERQQGYHQQYIREH